MTPKTAGRKPSKRGMIVSNLRQQIVDGRLEPGSCLPSRMTIQKQFDASMATVQQALDALVRDGFVYTRHGVGTFVAEKPPHLCHYGLVFWGHSGVRGWRRFDTALLNEASAIDKSRERRIRFYYGITEGDNDDEERGRLIADVRAHKLAGIIFAMKPPREMVEMAMLQSPQAPCVAIISRPDIPNVTAVTLSESFTVRALGYLAGQGRRRVAFLNPWQPSAELTKKWDESISSLSAANGMTCEPYWKLRVHRDGPECARDVIYLLFSQAGPARPDALCITDDNLVEHATAGLIAAGVRVPQDVDVVAHCNFPWATPSVMPVKRLGYDAREVLEQCIRVIDMQRQGEVPPRQVLVEAKFEEELIRQGVPLERA